jgi:hypothetical protein
VDAYLARLALSFLVGGGTVAAFTTIAERGNPRVGGLLLSFPVKVTVSLVLIALNEGVAFAAQSATATPAGMAANVVFIAATALLVRRLAPWPAIAAALALWAAAGLAIVLWLPAGLAWSFPLWALSAVVALLLLARLPRVHAAPPARPAPLSWWKLAGRAAGAGAVVAGSIVVAHYGGPILGGLASVFPSGFITTMVILTRKRGADFTGATVRVMVAGTAAPALFGVAIAFAYPALGILWGTLACLAFAACVSLGVGVVLRWRQSRREPAGHLGQPAPKP